MNTNHTNPYKHTHLTHVRCTKDQSKSRVVEITLACRARFCRSPPHQRPESLQSRAHVHGTDSFGCAVVGVGRVVFVSCAWKRRAFFCVFVCVWFTRRPTPHIHHTYTHIRIYTYVYQIFQTCMGVCVVFVSVHL